MIMIDTHVHYGDDAFLNDLQEIEKADRAAGIEKTLCLPITYEDNFSMFSNTAGYSDMYYAVGIHPLRVPALPEGNSGFSLKREEELYRKRSETLSEFRKMMQALDRLITDDPDRIVAVGETGIDTHTPVGAGNLRMQKISLREHIVLAQRHDLPLILHLRGEGALDEALSVMKHGKFNNICYRGIWHCFHDNRQQMERMMEASNGGFYFGIGGIVTYPQRGAVLRENLRSWDKEEILSKIVLETDAPFLIPEKEKSKDENARNISAYLVEVVSALSEILGVSEEKIVQRTTENAYRVLGFGKRRSNK